MSEAGEAHQAQAESKAANEIFYFFHRPPDFSVYYYHHSLLIYRKRLTRAGRQRQFTAEEAA
jgi:hypothetical protein